MTKTKIKIPDSVRKAATKLLDDLNKCIDGDLDGDAYLGFDADALLTQALIAQREQIAAWLEHYTDPLGKLLATAIRNGEVA